MPATAHTTSLGCDIHLKTAKPHFNANLMHANSQTPESIYIKAYYLSTASGKNIRKLKLIIKWL
jgi:hypothetical protein